MTTSILSLAFMLMHLRLRSISSAALASLFVGASACVRPSAYALIPALLVMVIFTWSAIQTRKVIIVIVAILPAIFICAVERLGTRSYHGSAARSLAGLIFFAKSGMIDAPPSIASSDPGKFALESALQSTFAPIRQLLLEVPRWDVREVISEAYEECLEYTCTKKLKESLNLSAPMVDKLIIEVGFARIARAPGAFALLVFDRYRSLWTLFKLRHPAALPVFKEFVQQHQPLPFQAEIPILSEYIEATMIALVVRPTIVFVGVVTLLMGLYGIICICYNLSYFRLAAASLTSLILHGSFLFTAIAGLGISRYTFGMWPIMMTAFILSLYWGLSELRHRASA